MSTKIRVKNFQSIKDAELNIEGFTVVTGTNNSGKTALQRAVRGVFQNTRGHSFVRYGESHSEVSVEFSDGTEVLWAKGKGTNKYVLNGKTFDKVGHGVPDEVAALGVTSLSCGNRTLWPQIAPQFTGQIFLLDEVGSVLAEAVSDVERVSQLNSALKKSESDKRSKNSVLKVRRKDKVQLEEELGSFEGLDLVGDTIQELKTLDTEVETKGKTLGELKTLESKHQTAVSVVEHLDGVENISLPETSRLKEVLKELKELNSLASRRDKTNALESSLVQTVDPFVRAVKGLNTDTLVEKIERYSQGISILKKLDSDFLDALGKVKQLEEEVHNHSCEIQAESRNLEKALEGQEQCPLCGKET